MAIIKIIPQKDTTINSAIDKNLGIDEILEVGVAYDTKSVSRMLIAFDMTYINSLNTLHSGIIGKYLNVYMATANTLPTNVTLECYQLTDGTWSNGVGNATYNDATGINWSNYLSTYDSSKIKLLEKSFDIYSDKDIQMDVSTSTTHSYLIKIKDDTILASGSSFSLKYFSKDTNTIYQPTLDYKFKDAVYTLPISGSVITKDAIVISLKNNTQQFYVGTTYRINLSVRDTFPKRVFLTTSLFSQKKYLTPTAYYAIRDIDAKHTIIDFDTDYTAISLDTEGNFFNLYTNNFETNRYYAIDVKVIWNGREQIFKDLYHFKLHDK